MGLPAPAIETKPSIAVSRASSIPSSEPSLCPTTVIVAKRPSSRSFFTHRPASSAPISKSSSCSVGGRGDARADAGLVVANRRDAPVPESIRKEPVRVRLDVHGELIAVPVGRPRPGDDHDCKERPAPGRHDERARQRASRVLDSDLGAGRLRTPRRVRRRRHLRVVRERVAPAGGRRALSGAAARAEGRPRERGDTRHDERGAARRDHET